MSPFIELTKTMSWTKFNDLKSFTKTDIQGISPELVERIRNPEIHAGKGACPLLVLGTFGDQRTAVGTLRHADNVITVTGIECDFDDDEGGYLSIEAASDTLRIFGIRAVLRTTASHTLEKPRWRIFLPLLRPHVPGARHGLVARVNGLLGGVLAIESSPCHSPTITAR